MAHEYSVQIHNWITGKVDGIKQDMKTASDPDRASYLSGQLAELEFIRDYMTRHIDLDTQQYYDK